MKCSTCKQNGHNKRSCKAMTTHVSAPIIKVETDVNVKASIKEEMSEDTYTKYLLKEQYALLTSYMSKKIHNFLKNPLKKLF